MQLTMADIVAKHTPRKQPRFKLKEYTPREAEVLGAIRSYLNLTKMLWARTNSGEAWRTGKGGKMYRISLCPEGWPDITCNWQGKALAIEVKRPGGKLSASQQAMKEAWERVGGIWITASSVDDVVRGLV